MELLLTKNPIIGSLHAKSVSDYFKSFVEEASEFNIATGFITNDSIAALKQIVEYRNGDLGLNLFIGMNYIEGFTKLQYNALRDLNSFLCQNDIGRVFLSPSALYHGKMYSFIKDDCCLGSFVGSSNLGSFVGTNQSYIESDILFLNDEASSISNSIHELISILGKDVNSLPEITKFIESDTKVLKNYSYVTEVSQIELEDVKSLRTGRSVKVPLKTEAKSNLNTYFGKGKLKNKYSPRGWYEVELILSKNLENLDILPDKDMGPFPVVTSDGFAFNCERQGDYSKNLRSSKDLKILGRWIKGQMENQGALQIGHPVTEETLLLFGKSHILFEETTTGTWFISLK